MYAFDAHGHGKSEPAAQSHRAFVKHFGDLVRLLHVTMGLLVHGSMCSAADTESAHMTWISAGCDHVAVQFMLSSRSF